MFLFPCHSINSGVGEREEECAPATPSQEGALGEDVTLIVVDHLALSSWEVQKFQMDLVSHSIQ